jgi:hypothetical protein
LTEDGLICTTNALVEVPITDLCRFEATGMRVDPLGMKEAG